MTKIGNSSGREERERIVLLQYVWAGDEPLPILRSVSHTLSSRTEANLRRSGDSLQLLMRHIRVCEKSPDTETPVSKVTIPIRSRLSFRYRNDWSGENRGRGRPRWGGRRQNSNLALGMPKADSICYRRLSPMIMLERLSSVEAYKVVAMINCTRCDVPGLCTDLPEVLGARHEQPGWDTPHCEQSRLLYIRLFWS